MIYLFPFYQIKLVKKMNEQISRHKEADSRKAREIAQLLKESRKQSNAIKSLQTQSAVKDQVLKRRIEEVAALKRDRKSNMSAKAAGRIIQKNSNGIFNAKQVRSKWETMQRTINRAARTKQTIIELERELERLVSERESLIRELNVVKRRQKIEDTTELQSEEDTIRSSLKFIQENITQVQHSIMEIEDGKQSAAESQNIQNILDNVRTFEEAKYLLEKLTSSSILQTCETALTQNRLVDNEALLDDVRFDRALFKFNCKFIKNFLFLIFRSNKRATFSISFFNMCLLKIHLLLSLKHLSHHQFQIISPVHSLI